MKDTRFQRIGATSNAAVGRAFEDAVKGHYARIGIELERDLSVLVGVSNHKKLHRFDLGSRNPPVIIECKSHTWTSGGNTPSAKMTVWNEAMYYFHVAPPDFKKVLFVLKHERQGISLANYYVKTHGHLIPSDVELWELEFETCNEKRIW